MKIHEIIRKSGILILVSTLLIALVNIGVVANGTTSIQNRLGLPDLNIINDMSIVFIDTNGNPIIGDPNINSRARIRFDWALFDRDLNGVIINELETDLIQPGDTFSFTLPSAFRVPNPINNINLSGFGTASIATNNVVTLTFNELVSQSSEIEGFIEFSASLNEGVLDGPGLKEIILPIREESTFTFNLVPTNLDTGINKLVHAVVSSANERNPSAITWEVQINKAYATLVNAVLTDVLPASLTLSEDANAIEVLPLFLNLDGTLKPLNQRYGTPLIEGVDYSVSGTTVTFLNTITTPYAIRFKTDIRDEFKPTLGGNLPITNQANLTSDGLDAIQASATYTAVYGQLLTKTRTGYNADNQLFTWRVQYNFGEITLVNPIIVDTFSNNMTFVEGSLSIRSEANVLLLEGVDYAITFDDDSNQLTISFLGTINEAYTIVYQTTLRPEVIVSGSNISVTNSVASEGIIVNATGTANPRVVVKSSNSINYATRQISWQIALNINRYTMSNMVVTDVYNSLGLEMVSLVVRDITLNSIIDPSNYILTKTFNSEGVETGFILEFINDYATTNNRLRIDLVTEYDMNNKPDISGIARNRFRNTATMNWVDHNGISRTDSSSANRDVNTQTVLNGQKSGNYNAVTKEITWNIRVNYHNDALVLPRLVDPILGGQTFIANSLSIFEYAVNSNGTMVRVGGALDLSNFVIEYPSASNDFVFVIDFPTNGSRRFEIEFKTSLENQMIVNRYTNIATFSNDGREHPLESSVTITNGNDLLTKSGVQVGSLIRWSIAINQSQSTIRDAFIEDIPSTNQRLVLDSFKLFPTIMSVNGTYTINRSQPLVREIDYELEFIFLEDGSQRFNLRFLNEITRPYVLEYESEINTTPGNTSISNSVVMNGNGVTFEDQGDDTTIIINIESAGGGAVGVQGSLQVLKLNPEGEPLQGVVFNLINRHNRIIGTQTTNEQGVVVFRNLVYGTYTLREVSTVGNYVISDELFAGLSVSINAQSSDPSVFTTITNRKNQTIIRKVDVNGNLLNGSVFRLETLSSEGWMVLEESLEVNNGSIQLDGLSAGRYRLLEVGAPLGFIINTNPLEFEVTENMNGQRQDITVNFVNYQGSVQLTKTNALSQVLEGVIFNLLDEEGNSVRAGLITNEEGIIEVTGLAPGNYQFIEISSVQGNLVNTTPITFTIEAEAQGAPEVVQVSSRNGRASVEFIKVDQGGNPLEGARFELYQLVGEERNLINNAIFSQENGLVRVDNLTPGRYEFIEVETVEGFILNTQVIEFEIPETAQTDVFVLTLDDFVNYQGTIRLIKVNRRDQIIGEATFEIYYEGELKYTLTTLNGILDLNGLAPGVYTFIEIEEPEGYILDDTPFDITIIDSFEGSVEPIEIRFMNFGGSLLGDDDEDIPSTGDSSGLLSWILLMMGAFLVVASKKSKTIV